MAFDLSSILKDVSTPDTGLDQIRYLPYASLIPDPQNGYSMDGIEDLARNIELVGLQQPPRVRQLSETAFGIVSGHRRHAAIGLILKRNPGAFPNGVPCIVDREAISTALREFQLILGNSDNRKLTPADEAQQLDRLSDCIRRLEDEGYEFPGRHRDWRAKLSGMSRTKIARLQAIQHNLASSLLPFFNSGALPVTAAYRLSQEPAEIQTGVFRTYGGKLKELTEAQLEEAINRRKTPPKAEAHAATEASGSSFNADEYLTERAREDALFYQLLCKRAMEFIRSLPEGCTRQEGIEALKKTHRHAYASACADRPWYQGGPKGLSLGGKVTKGKPIFRTWTEVYDMLSTIALQLAAQIKPDRGPDWQTGQPLDDGRYLCLVDMNTSKLHEQRCEYRDGKWLAYGQPIHELFSVKAWWPLPPEMAWLPHEAPEDAEETDDG